MPKNAILKVPDGRWQYQVMDASGNRLTIKSKKGESKKDFRLRCDALDEQAENANNSNFRNFDELFHAWLEHHAKPNLSLSDVRMTENVYEQFIRPYLGQKELGEISKQLIYRTLSKAAQSVQGGASRSYVAKMRGAISRPYNWGISSLGLDITNPTIGLVFRVPDKPKRQRVITPDDWERIQEAARYSKYLCYFQLLYQTGLRPSEGLGLQADDIKDNQLEIRRGITIYGLSDLKTDQAERNIPLTPELKQLLYKQISATAFKTQEHWLFPAASGAPNLNTVVSAFDNILKNTATFRRGGRNGMKKIEIIQPALHYSLYDFRHTFATRMAESGMPLKTLQAIMGHKNVSTTMQFYVDVTPKMLEEAIDFMRIKSV